tara:strand:- start:358 stop:612 length:255 start_codon:yes stop_codon:yes gene_type:complete
MEIVTEYWHQIVFFLGAIVVAVRLQSDVNSNKRELSQLKDELDRRDTYVETVKQRAEIDIHGKQISTLWEFVNKLRDKMNGGPL